MAAATWYVDTTAGAGGNDGTSKADAWVNIRSAFEYGSYDAGGGDVIYVRRNQTHTMSASDAAIGDSGILGNPIRIIGDNDTLEIWSEDSGDVRPIVDWGSGSYAFNASNDNFWEVHNLNFHKGEGYTIYLSNSRGWRFVNCTWTTADGATPVYPIRVYSGSECVCEDCAFENSGVLRVEDSGGTYVYDCTFDSAAAYALAVVSSYVYLENVVEGGTTPSTTAAIQLIECTIVRGRNVTMNAGTEIALATDARGKLVSLEDYDGTKGAWYQQSDMGILTSVASAGTPDGQRAGGAVTVIKAVVNAAASAYAPMKCAEFVKNLAAGDIGTPDVTVYIQPDNADTSVPDVQGADADVWVEVLAWDVGNSEYKRFDSRDKAAQDAAADETWGAIVTENVEVDAAGTIIIRVWCASEDTFYIDVPQDADVA